MTTKKYIQIIALLFSITACGTGIGNGVFGDDPTNPNPSAPITLPPPSDEELDEVIEAYNESSLPTCGVFTEANTVAELDSGRLCIRQADENCNPKKYLYNKTNTDGSRFVSFVSIVENAGECQVRVHTVSDVPGNYISDTRTCDDFTENQIPEAACGLFN